MLLLTQKGEKCLTTEKKQQKKNNHEKLDVLDYLGHNFLRQTCHLHKRPFRVPI